MDDNIVEEFWDWFDRCRGSASVRQVEEQGGFPHGRISNRYTPRLPPTYATVEAIAAGLHLPKEEVMRRAGLLPRGNDDPSLMELIDLAKSLTPEARREISRYMRFRLREQLAPEE